jgi:hypothetical protein
MDLGDKLEEETGDPFDLEGQVVLLSEIAANQWGYWERRAEEYGREMLASVRSESGRPSGEGR